MGSQGLHLYNGRIYQYPKLAFSGTSDFGDYLRSNRANTNTLQVGDYVLPESLKRRAVEQLYDEFSKEQKNTKENLVDLLLFATGILEKRFLIINRITDIKGNGSSGKITLKPYSVICSDTAGESPIMQNLTYRRSGKSEKTVTVKQFELNTNLSGSILAASAMDKGFAQMARLVLAGPTGRMKKVTKPIIGQTVQLAAHRFFTALPSRTVQLLENKVSGWTSIIVSEIERETAKDQLKTVDSSRIRSIIRKTLRHTVKETIAVDMADGMMDSLKIAGFTGARYELRKQIEKHLTGRFVERVLNTATKLYIENTNSKSSNRKKGIGGAVSHTNKLANFIRAELDNSTRGVVAGKVEF